MIPVCKERKSCKLFYQLSVPSRYCFAQYGRKWLCQRNSCSRNHGSMHWYNTDWNGGCKLLFGPEGRDVKLRNTQYPDISVVNRCSMIRDFGDKTVNVLEIWVTYQRDNLNSGIVILILVVVAGLSGWQIHRRIQAYKRKHKQHRKRRRRWLSLKNRKLPIGKWSFRCRNFLSSTGFLYQEIKNIEYED